MPETRTVFMSIALVGIGSLTGAFLDRLSFPHVAQIFNTCASSKQFITEFRVHERRDDGSPIPGVVRDSLQEAFSLKVDGVNLGELGGYDSVRRFFCEGNHRARLRWDTRDGVVEHEVEFALSRPSLFHITEEHIYQGSKAISKTCISDLQCQEDVFLELSPYEPDDLRVRIFPVQR